MKSTQPEILPTHGSTESEWSVVTNGKGLPMRKQKEQPTANTIPYYTQSPPSATSRQRRRQRQRQRQRDASRTACYMHQLNDRLYAIRDQLKSSEWWAGTRNLILETMGGGPLLPNTAFVQCLGIGSFEQSKWSLHQLACAMLIQDLTSAPLCSIADPVMTATDIELAERIGLDVRDSPDVDDVTILGDENDDIDSWGVLFMPHCGRDLNFAVLNRWLDQRRANNIVYVGNCLSSYRLDDEDNVYAGKRELFERVSDMIESQLFKQTKCPNPKLSPDEFAFNDLVVAHFSCKSNFEVKH